MAYPSPPPESPRPRVLFLGKPKHTGGGIEENQRHFDIHILDATDRNELLERLPHTVATRGPYQAVVCRLGTQPFEPFDAELLSPLLPHVRIIVSAQIGYNDFDIEWMTRHDIWFCNSRRATADSTANMALFLILAVLRDTSRGEKIFRQGLWRTGLNLSRDPAGLTLGIIGMGNIGKRLAHKATALDMQVQYWNRSGRCRHHDEVGYDHSGDSGNPGRGTTGYTYCESLRDLLATSDIVSLHCPLSAETAGLIGRQEIALMKGGACIINTARGPLIDQHALIDALETGKLARAGLDVFTDEPAGVHPYFMSSDKVVVQPHMGGLTEGSFARAEQECFANIYMYFKSGSRPVAPVNEIRYRKGSALEAEGIEMA